MDKVFKENLDFVNNVLESVSDLISPCIRVDLYGLSTGDNCYIELVPDKSTSFSSSLLKSINYEYEVSTKDFILCIRIYSPNYMPF